MISYPTEFPTIFPKTKIKAQGDPTLSVMALEEVQELREEVERIRSLASAVQEAVECRNELQHIEQSLRLISEVTALRGEIDAITQEAAALKSSAENQQQQQEKAAAEQQCQAEAALAFTQKQRQEAEAAAAAAARLRAQAEEQQRAAAVVPKATAVEPRVEGKIEVAIPKAVAVETTEKSTAAFYTLEQLQSIPPECERLKLEMYLSDIDFQKHCGCTKAEFVKMPQWKQKQKKVALSIW